MIFFRLIAFFFTVDFLTQNVAYAIIKKYEPSWPFPPAERGVAVGS